MTQTQTQERLTSPAPIGQAPRAGQATLAVQAPRAGQAALTGQAALAGQAIGQAVGQAESVLTRLLAAVLAETGTPRQTYLALQRLAALGDAADREVYVLDLGNWLDLDLWAAGELASDLMAAGLVTGADERVLLAAAGADLRAQIRDSIGAVMAPVWETLDQADLETTVRTLREITVRARATLVRRASYDAYGEQS